MAYYLKLMGYSDRANPWFRWDNEDDYRQYGSKAIGFSLGFWVDPRAFPETAQQARKKLVHDVFPMPRCNGVSQRFKDLVEEFEPGVHQFVPIKLRNKAGEAYEGNYYVFNCMVAFDALLVNEMDRDWEYHNATDGPNLALFRTSLRDRIVVSSPRIAGKHLWTPLYLGPDYMGVFCSDAFQKELVARKIRYLDAKHCEELDIPWLPEENIQPALDWEAKHGIPCGYRAKLRAEVLKKRGKLEL
ncbi:imm11 family protein [Roseibium denhamense]|uniref:Immunity MXAN-0049 protein domain-containing protein n=1 Tax=Roseibium denhamense TaxID=76305 RepID=A0ABY1PCI3_9HYPH|nr:DUF1629 domain-containing protein [Roseibium denhamense]SMP30832.1 hypothetical protein SAMN06265374_3338 [Roseibium denhamense]